MFSIGPEGFRKLVASPYLLLAAIVALQSALSLSLYNFAFQDEALYIHTGKWMIDSWNGRYPFDLYPETYFSGAPTLYPVIAGWLDDLGGLALVRAASTLLMGLTTVFVYKTARAMHLDGERKTAALFAAGSFALCSSVLFVGHFATFDAPAFCALAVASWFAVRANNAGETWWKWAAAASLALTVAVFFKYATTVAVPFVVLAAFAGTSPPLKVRIVRAATITAVFGVLVALCVATWAGPLWDGFVSSTANRDPIAPSSPTELLGKVLGWAWVPLLVAAVGLASMARTRRLLGLVLLAGMVVPVGLQVLSGEDVSLQKHVVMSMLFAAPLCGHVLARWCSRRATIALPVVAVVAMCLQGASASSRLFDDWPDARPLVAALTPLVRNDPGFHILGDNPEPFMYGLYDQTAPTQWDSTYGGAFEYQGRNGTAAYEAAVRDKYFGLIVFDGHTDTSKQVQPLLAPSGYNKVTDVTDPRTYRTWSVYRPS